MPRRHELLHSKEQCTAHGKARRRPVWRAEALQPPAMQSAEAGGVTPAGFFVDVPYSSLSPPQKHPDPLRLPPSQPSVVSADSPRGPDPN